MGSLFNQEKREVSEERRNKTYNEHISGISKAAVLCNSSMYGMVVGYQLSRVLFANVRLCLGIGAVCAVILGILAFRFYRAGLFLVCAVLMFLL